MPKRPEGVYGDAKKGWYLKIDLGRDKATGRRNQITRRGFRTAGEASEARQVLLEKRSKGRLTTNRRDVTVGELLDEYLDGADADGHLSAKTRFDYRHSADDYVRPYLGSMRMRDLEPQTILNWQRTLSESGGTKRRIDRKGKQLPGKGLSSNTIRLARAPLAGALKLAVSRGWLAQNPLADVRCPPRCKSVPKHWTPEQAREFLMLMHGDRTWAMWAFLLASGLRVNELVSLRWSNVDLGRLAVRVVDFSSTLGYEVVPSDGKSGGAVRTVELDDELVKVLQIQRQMQQNERDSGSAKATTEEIEHVFTMPTGRAYHPQYVSRRLAKYSEELGLPRLTAHGLRHTSATLMLASGVPPKVAAERLGHADITLFLNLYSHVTPTMQTEAASRIGQALFGILGDAMAKSE